MVSSAHLLNKINQQNVKNKIDKIIIPQNIKIAFILTGGDGYSMFPKCEIIKYLIIFILIYFR